MRVTVKLFAHVPGVVVFTKVSDGEASHASLAVAVANAGEGAKKLAQVIEQIGVIRGVKPEGAKHVAAEKKEEKKPEVAEVKEKKPRAPRKPKEAKPAETVEAVVTA